MRGSSEGVKDCKPRRLLHALPPKLQPCLGRVQLRLGADVAVRPQRGADPLGLRVPGMLRGVLDDAEQAMERQLADVTLDSLR